MGKNFNFKTWEPFMVLFSLFFCFIFITSHKIHWFCGYDVRKIQSEWILLQSIMFWSMFTVLYFSSKAYKRLNLLDSFFIRTNKCAVLVTLGAESRSCKPGECAFKWVLTHRMSIRSKLWRILRWAASACAHFWICESMLLLGFPS